MARPTRSRRSPRFRVLLVSGLVLILGALGVVGYLAWELWGTDVVSQRRHVSITEDLERAWAVGEGVVAVPEGEAASIVRIPRFGKDYAVPVLEDTTPEVLAAGFGHFVGTAEPGQVGNFALAAHRITHGEPLRQMPELQKGDQIIIDTAHTRYTYELISPGEGLRVSFTNTWVVDPVPHNPVRGGIEPPQRPTRLLTLTTCAELFFTHDRLIAFGELVDEQPLPRG